MDLNNIGIGAQQEIKTPQTGTKTSEKREIPEAGTEKENYISSETSSAYRAYGVQQINSNKYKDVTDEELFKVLDFLNKDKLFAIDYVADTTHDILRELIKNRGYFYANDGKHGLIHPEKTDILVLEDVHKNGNLNEKTKDSLKDSINTRWAKQAVGAGGTVYTVTAKDGHKATIMKDPESNEDAVIITNFDNNGIASETIHTYPEDVTKYL